MPKNLAGLPILITGASSGIGLAAARACAAAGMSVALTARREDRLTEAAAKINAAGGKAVALRCDVTNPDECELVVARATEALGPLYSVFANAGYGFESPVYGMDDDRLRELFETNFFGSLNIIRPALGGMLERRRGHVMFCSSGLSKISLPNFAAYCASKAMQDHFGRSMRLELLDSGVHVSTVHPISTDTEFSDVVSAKADGQRRSVRTPKGMRQTADHVADCVVRCLRSPRGEVWPAPMARFVLAVATAFPSLADRVLAGRQRKIDAGEA
ncbi:MAG: SDR family NAD(P)-dependent oxidoreductase [Phycisphaerales bacterium]